MGDHARTETKFFAGRNALAIHLVEGLVLSRRLEHTQVAFEAQAIAPPLPLTPVYQILRAVEPVSRQHGNTSRRQPASHHLQQRFLLGKPNPALGLFRQPVGALLVEGNTPQRL